MLSQLYAIPTEEPRETPSEAAMLPMARMVRDEWVTTFFQGSHEKDNWTQEDSAKREEYLSLMLKEPAVSTAFWSLIASVMSLPLKVHAADPDNPREVYWANFTRDAVSAVSGGVPRLIANTAAGGLLFGFGLCEMVFDYPERGKWRKNLVLTEYAPLDSRYIRFDLDPFKRVRGVRGLKANGGQVFDPDRFAIFSHQSLFGSPFGISKFRAAYRAAKMMESAVKLRIILLQNFTGPFLLLKSGGATTRETAMRVLSEARALGYMVCDRQDEAEVLNMAAGSDSEFQSAIDDLRKEMYTAIRWGYLPFTEAQSGVQVGNSEVQKSMTQLGEWMLATEIAQVFSDQIVKPLIRANCPDDEIGFPTVSLGGQNSTDKQAVANIFESAKRLGLTLSKRQLQRALDIEEPNGPDDEIRDPIQAGPGGNPFIGQPGIDPTAGGMAGGDAGPGGPPQAGPNGAPVPGAPSPEQPQPNEKIDLSSISQGIGKVTPTEMDKAALVAALDLRARAVSLGRPGQFQRAIDALQGMIGNHPAMRAAIMQGGQSAPPKPDQSFGWMAGRSKSGGVKAVGTGEHSGRTLYGTDAQRVLSPQQPAAAKQPDPTSGSKAAEPAKQVRQPAAAKPEATQKAEAETRSYQSLGKQVGTMNVEEVKSQRQKLAPTPAVEEMAGRLAGHALEQTGENLTGGKATEALHGHLNAAQGLSDEQRSLYGSAIDRVTHAMPDAAHERIATHLKGGATFHADTASIADGVKADVLSIARADRHPAIEERFKGMAGEKFGGGYVIGKGTIHIDGGKDGASPHEVYAHTLGHVLDGPKQELSNSDQWWDAFTSEIAMQPDGSRPLGRHAASEPGEGFAEFSRLLYGSDVPHAEVAKRFPRATAVFRKNGLLPEGFDHGGTVGPDVGANRPAHGRSTAAMAIYGQGRDERPGAFALPERFAGKVEVHPDGSHIDMLAGKAAENPAPSKDSPLAEQFKAAHVGGDELAMHDLIAESLQGKHGDDTKEAVNAALDEHYANGAKGGADAKHAGILKVLEERGDADESDLPASRSKLSAKDDPFADDDEFNERRGVTGADLLSKLDAVGDDGKPLARGKAKGGSDSLHHLVAKSGGIDPESVGFLTHFGSVNEAVEQGIPRTAFRKGGRDPQELAQELHNEGHIAIPGQASGDDRDAAPDVDGTAHLFEQLMGGAKSLHSAGDQYAAAEAESLKRDQEAAGYKEPKTPKPAGSVRGGTITLGSLKAGEEPAKAGGEPGERKAGGSGAKPATREEPDGLKVKNLNVKLKTGGGQANDNEPASVLHARPDPAPGEAIPAEPAANSPEIPDSSKSDPYATDDHEARVERWQALGHDDEYAETLAKTPWNALSEKQRGEYGAGGDGNQNGNTPATGNPQKQGEIADSGSADGNQNGNQTATGKKAFIVPTRDRGYVAVPQEKNPKVAKISNAPLPDDARDKRSGTVESAEAMARDHFAAGKPGDELLDNLEDHLTQKERSAFEKKHGVTFFEQDRNADLAKIYKNLGSPKETVTAPVDSNKSGPHAAHVDLANRFAERFKSGEPITAREARDLADAVHGGTQGEGKYGPSDMYDSMEAGLNRHIMDSGEYDPTHGYMLAKTMAEELADKVRQLPTQTNRSGTKDSFQQFSTPPHYAYAANWVANHQPGDQVLEPSAGTGSLAVHAKNAGTDVHVNELDPRRRALLADQFGTGKVHAENAEQIGAILPKRGIKPDTVVMNPPFSQTAGRLGDKKDLGVAGQHIKEALATLKPGGRLVAIVGRGMHPDSPTHRAFFDEVKKNHELRANVGISGDEYRKYGTSFGTRMLVIDKTGKPHSGETVAGDAENIPHAMQMLEGVRNDRRRTPEPATGLATGQATVGTGAGTGRDTATAPTATRPDMAPPTKRSDESPVSVAGGTPRTDAGGLPAGDARLEGMGREPVRAESGRDGDATRGEREPAGNDVANPQGTTGPTGGGTGSGERPKRVRKPASGESVPQPAGSRAGLRAPERIVTNAVKKDKPAKVAKAAEDDSTEIAAGTKQVGGENSVFQSYAPARVSIEGAKPHPTPLVESAAMAAVRPPEPTYHPVLSRDIIESGKLTEAQLESLTYAGQAHDKMLAAAPGAPAVRRGYFIGDGTGAAKGRQVAGIIMDNMNQGRKKHVWISQKQSLFNDAGRDWKDIGGDPSKLFHFDEIKDGSEGPKDGIAFITYDTLKGRPTDPTKPTNMDQLLKWLGPDFDGTISFDEAHTMANAIQTDGGRGMKDASQRALAGVDLQNRLPNARVTYVSATGATDPGNLAYAERLGIWGYGTPFPTKQSFISEMEKGGIAAMESVAQSLKATGGYTSRMLSPEGLTYDRLTHHLTDEQKGNYDIMADAWQKVLANIDDAMEITGAHKNGMAKAAAKSQFWGAQQRFFNQVMTSMQTPSVIRSMQEDLKNGHAPVVQLVNTMEAAAKRAKSKLGEGEDLEQMDVSPKEVLFQYLEKSFPIHRYEEYEDDNGNVRTRIVQDSEGNPVIDPQAAAIRDQMLSEVAMLKIPKSPIDMIIDHFGHENVSEATGRKSRFIQKEGPDGKRKLTEDKRGKNANAGDTADFQGGKKKIMIFSDAGGTGSSYHADNNAGNTAQRVHYVLQPGWRADNAVQGLGRTHRTNQKTAPIVKLVEIEQLKGQKRFVSTIARRLDQLGALTRGQRQAGSGLFSAADNLEGPQAKEAMETFFRDLEHGRIEGLDHRDTMRQLGLEVSSGDDDTKRRKKGADGPSDMGQFLNRLLSLRVDTQAKVFEAYEDRLNSIMEQAKAAGKLDTGVENFPAVSLAKSKSNVVYQHPDSGAEVRHVVMKAKRKNEVRTFRDTTMHGRDLPLAYVKNDKTGKVYSVHQAADTTDATTGKISQRYALRSPKKSRDEYRSRDEVLSEYGDVNHLGGFRRLANTEAETAWNEELSTVPTHTESEEHFLTGALLPIWNKIPGGQPKIYRLKADDGTTTVGRHIPKKHVEVMLRNLGVAESGPVHQPADVFGKLRTGDLSGATLSNGWNLKPSRVQDEKRVEVLGVDPYSSREWEQLGGVKHRIGYETRHFIPIGENGHEVLDRILKARNATITDVNE